MTSSDGRTGNTTNERAEQLLMARPDPPGDESVDYLLGAGTPMTIGRTNRNIVWGR